jgi:hypothetical protein
MKCCALVCRLVLRFIVLLAMWLMPPLIARAETLETNDPNIVVKSVYCVAFDLSGVLVNRGQDEFHGVLTVAVRDEDGDIVGRGRLKLRAGAENGRRFSFYYINTMNCRRHKFEFNVVPEIAAK